jgi:transcription elongation GreA/GreB family factor
MLPLTSAIHAISRALVTDSDDDELSDLPDLPDLPVSEYPNYVTPRGLALLNERLEQTQQRLADLDPNAESAPLDRAHAAREQRWLQGRVHAAIPVSSPADTSRVGFGATVELTDQNETAYRYRIVGEDEADPEHGLVSWVSPLARALNGARAGDSVVWPRPAGDLQIDVLAIRYDKPLGD